MSANTNTVAQRQSRSGGFMRYSLALATIFAVLIFTGINPPGQGSSRNLVSNAGEQTTIQNPSQGYSQRSFFCINEDFITLIGYLNKNRIYQSDELQEKPMYTSKKAVSSKDKYTAQQNK